jgi:hypothetical protein
VDVLFGEMYSWLLFHSGSGFKRLPPYPKTGIWIIIYAHSYKFIPPVHGTFSHHHKRLKLKVYITHRLMAGSGELGKVGCTGLSLVTVGVVDSGDRRSTAIGKYQEFAGTMSPLIQALGHPLICHREILSDKGYCDNGLWPVWLGQISTVQIEEVEPKG